MANKKYFLKQTEQALQNFPFPLPKTHMELIYAIVEIKTAAARANYLSGKLDRQKKDSIFRACDDVLSGKYDDQFVTSSLQGGAGTSINMNVNEVIATLAGVHPNDHVNMSQSTNDINPSALKIVCIRLTVKILQSLDNLLHAFGKEAKKFAKVKKLGRTHLQDAIPTTLGQEFASYRTTIERDKKRLEDALPYLYELNLGGTAIGNSINASTDYIKWVYRELKKITNLPLRPTINFMSQTNSQSDICHLSAVLTILCLDLSKIANDLRFLASGPRGGIGEIALEELQNGSSIMPGKINPVIPETINQVYYSVSGRNLTIQQAAEASHLELAIMFPVVADSIITSLKIVDVAINLFTDKCIKTIVANKKRCEELLEKSTAFATLLVPVLGYDTTSKIVKEAIKKNKTIRAEVLKRKLLTNKEINKILKR